MKQLNLTTRLALGFLLVAVLPLAGLAWFYLDSFERALSQTVLQNIASIADKKADQIDTFINERLEDVQSLGRSRLTHTALLDIQREQQHRQFNTKPLTSAHRTELSSLIRSSHYHDLLLIDVNGDVLFSLRQESDLGTNLIHGPYRDTGLAMGFRQAMASLHTDLTPFDAYAPSNGKIAGFLVAPLMDKGKPIGALALQLNLDVITPVVADRTGLGSSGETVLALRQGADLLYTGPLNHNPDAAFRQRTAFDQGGPPMRLALAGGHDQGLTTDYSGTPVAAAWRYLPALRWGMVVKVDSAEAFAPAHQARHTTGLALAIFLIFSGAAALLLGRRFVHTEGIIAAQEARYRAMFGNMNDGVALFRPCDNGQDFTFLDFNAAAEHIAGLTRQQVLGRRISELFPGVKTAGILEAMRRVQTTCQMESIAQTHYQDDRLSLWLENDVIRLPGGEILSVFKDVTERKNAEERITHLAHHDSLTGLCNRYNLENRLAQALLQAHRDQLQVAVLFIDLDRFKVINDTLDRHIGDLLLIEVARRLRDVVRESDIVARQGGDEFVVVLTQLESPGDVTTVAGKILLALGRPYTAESHTLHSTPSIGISLFPEDGEDVETLIKNADTAMYHAKEQGRNNFQYFTPALNAIAGERLELERDLREAIAQRQFELHYQPQIRATDNELMGVEALVRWRHPKKGLISPLRFIPIAEETGQIEALGAWVLDEACRQLVLWRQQNVRFNSLRMAVNLSAHQLRAANLIEVVRHTLKRHQLGEGDLELEITESVAMHNPEQAISQLQALRRLGVQLAIDDFGTGYSSLAYLKRLPIQILKLDQEFVRDIETDANDAAISAATLALAHSLGLQVVAEGVETEAQRSFLVAHRCDFLQGFGIGRPMPGPDLPAWLATHGGD